MAENIEKGTRLLQQIAICDFLSKASCTAHAYTTLEYLALNLPSLIIFGAIKSGTGALHQYLNHHPDIFMSPIKEPRYFMHEDLVTDSQHSPSTAMPIKRLEDYAEVFAKAEREQVIGESSSCYIYSEFAAKKIQKTLPNVRLVASLRNPVDRACAHFQMINKTKKINPSMLEGKLESWAQSSFYYEELVPYFKLFPREHIKVVIYEEWVTNKQRALKDLYKFLGVDDTFELDDHVVYRPATVLWPSVRQGGMLRKLKPYIPTRLLMLVNNYKARGVQPVEDSIPIEMRQTMNDWYSQDIQRLEELLDQDLSLWRTDSNA